MNQFADLTADSPSPPPPEEQNVVTTAIATTTTSTPPPPSRPLINPYTGSNQKSAANAASAATNAGPSPQVTTATPAVLAQKPSTTKILNNPYKKKFVGGAEAARQMARKKAKTTTRIVSPLERERLKQVLPDNMNPMERFGAALLRTSPSDFVQSEGGGGNNHSAPNQASKEVWSQICQRVGLTLPTERVKERYNDPQTHFAVRAALVLEEARSAIAQPLAQKWKSSSSGGGGRNDRDSMILMAHYSEPNSNGHLKVTFRNASASPLSKEQLFHIRPGTVFRCVPRDSARRLADVLLGYCQSSAMSRDEGANAPKECTLTWFRDLPQGKLEQTEWVVTPLCTTISELRCFEAMTNRTIHHVPFLGALLGAGNPEQAKKSTYIVFDDNGNPIEEPIPDDGHQKKEGRTGTIKGFFEPKNSSNGNQGPFTLPKLNPTQERAADTFLNSERNTITLIQGPPGTGKTTLLVNIICRYLLQQKSAEEKKRLLVCAPTNKAITVLATRFMKATNHDKSRYSPLMVGDADKLLAEERSSNQNKENYNPIKETSLRSVFVFTWVQAMADDYRKIRNHFAPPSIGARSSNNSNNQNYSLSDLHKLAKRLERRLSSNLPHMPKEFQQRATRVARAMNTLQEGGIGVDIVSILNPLIKQLDAMAKQPGDFVYRQLISNADIVFCTLASAGGMVLKGHHVDDLIVDEAAAATEPELCIPLHLMPSRLLCVGDPKQLPATVLSRRAIDMGLSESLHERLMFRCNQEHIMLDVQYRMNPEISSFPSHYFYQARINNGENVQSPSHCGPVSLLDGSPYIFLKVEGAEEQGFGGSYKNQAEARCVVDLVQQLRNAAAHQDDQWHTAAKIRIITFYQAQVALLKWQLRNHKLQDVVVATVDSSQGCEADIVLVSFVRSNTQTAGFLTDDRRMNVALTRAKYQLICVGNVGGLQRMNGAKTLNELANNAVERSVVQPLLGSSGNRKAAVNQQLDAFYN